MDRNTVSDIVNKLRAETGLGMAVLTSSFNEFINALHRHPRKRDVGYELQCGWKEYDLRNPQEFEGHEKTMRKITRRDLVDCKVNYYQRDRTPIAYCYWTFYTLDDVSRHFKISGPFYATISNPKTGFYGEYYFTKHSHRRI